MIDALNQKDIDALLKGAMPAAPPTAQVEVVPYNFLRPPRISRDRRATIEGIYGRFAVALQALLSSRLRLPMDVVVGSVEQATFGEFLLSMGNPCAAFVFDLGDGHNSQGVMDFSAELSLYLVDRMFGGPGEVRPADRPLTQLERLLVKQFADRALGFLGEVWQDFLPFSPVQTGFESVPDALQIANKEDNVLVANIDVRGGQFAGLMTVCVPLHALELFLQEKPAAVRQTAKVNPVEQAQQRMNLESSLRVAALPVTARFPVFSLRAGDVAKLAVGQVIHTSFPLDVPLEVHVNGRRRFLGVPGQLRRGMGVRITNVLPSGQAEPKERAARARVV